jgi:hypothetical protein
MNQWAKCVVACAALLVAAGTGYSQSTFAAITGTVVDSTGAVVSNVTVTVTHMQTDIKSTGKSN